MLLHDKLPISSYPRFNITTLLVLLSIFAKSKCTQQETFWTFEHKHYLGYGVTMPTRYSVRSLVECVFMCFDNLECSFAHLEDAGFHGKYCQVFGNQYYAIAMTEMAQGWTLISKIYFLFHLFIINIIFIFLK